MPVHNKSPIIPLYNWSKSTPYSNSFIYKDPTFPPRIGTHTVCTHTVRIRFQNGSVLVGLWCDDLNHTGLRLAVFASLCWAIPIYCFIKEASSFLSPAYILLNRLSHCPVLLYMIRCPYCPIRLPLKPQRIKVQPSLTQILNHYMAQ